MKRRTESKKQKKKANLQGSSAFQPIGRQPNYIFQKNIEALAARYPKILQLLNDMGPSLDYELIGSENGMPNLHIKSRNMYYYDQQNPVADAKRQLDELKLKNTRLATFLGIGLGYEVIQFANEYSIKQKTASILVIEKDPYIFLAALRSLDLSEIINHDQVHFLVGLPEESLFQAIYDYFVINQRFVLIKAMQPVYHLSALRLNKSYYLYALSQVREAASLRITEFGNCPEDSMIGVENMLDNLNEILENPGIELLYDAFRGKPGIVIASGPSLNKNKHLLKGLENKAVMVCADSTLRILIEMGIKPHLVGSLERIPPTVRVMSGFKKEDVENVYYAACPVVPKGAYEVYPGPRIIVYRTFDHFKWLGIEKGMLNVKMSSGNMAFKLASALGCDPIIVIGQDLAFSEDDKTHATGSDYGETQSMYYQRPRVQVPGNLGKPVWTDAMAWVPCIKGYEQDVAEHKGLVVNSTEGGAYIQGTQVLSFQEAIDRYIRGEIDPLGMIQERLASFTTTDTVTDAAKVLQLIENTQCDLLKMQGYCKEGIAFYEKHKSILMRCLEDEEYLKEQEDNLTQMYQDITCWKIRCYESHFTWQYFLTHIVQSFTIKFEMEIVEMPGKHDNWRKAQISEALHHAEWYAVINDIIMICVDMLVKAKATVVDKYGESEKLIGGEE